ncbi:hypothetical protein COO91_04148 [Nostoc flagelliforme CCNUN1]|uniref:Uncharacterized protein n=1 Tax=Nostoc flagelliforme CCNUN1 TaxID=2038116 RepID=A0A2K8SS84_9NOSO|nr:hypothetical protein COO91_04148 [Nostoc flagelliforme CCNUN1]
MRTHKFREWGIGNGEWGDEGDEADEGDEENNQCPMPHAQYPMTNLKNFPPS